MLLLYQNPLAKAYVTLSTSLSIFSSPCAKNSFIDNCVKYVIMLVIAVCLNAQVYAQTIYAPLVEDSNSVIFPFQINYNDQAIAQTKVRYGLWAASSPFVLEQMMVLYDVYEKIPAAFRLVPDGSNFPIWNFRYWPEEELFTWAEIRDYSIKPVVGYVCDRNFEVIDTFGIGNPHEFYVMPNNLGYAFLGSQQTGGVTYPTVNWVSANHNTNFYWSAADPAWGISPAGTPQSTCSYTTLDTFDNNIIDFYHPNSIAAIQTAVDTVKIGIFNRNTDSEFEITATFNGTKWVTSSVQVLSKSNHLGHQSDDSVWVNTAHDLQYLYANKDTLVKSLWDNGGCRAKPNTGYKVFIQSSGDSIRTTRKGLYDVLGQSTAMGNGGVMLQNRYASSISEINNALSFGNIGSTNFDLSNDNGVPKLGVWDNSNTMVFAINQDYSFLTYRFYPYFDNQLPFDDLRPYINISFSPDSSAVTLSLDSNNYTDILWIDGVTDVWSRTLTYQQFQTQELVAFVTNNPDWFWFSSHRYKGALYVGLNEVMEPTNEVSFYPNPVKAGNAINLSTHTDVTVTDITGKVVASCNVCNTLTLPISTGTGMYLLTTINGKAISRKKVLVY